MKFSGHEGVVRAGQPFGVCGLARLSSGKMLGIDISPTLRRGVVSIWIAKASSFRNRLFCASAIQNSRMLVSVSRCNGSSVILTARSQSAAFSHGSTEPRSYLYRIFYARSSRRTGFSPQPTAQTAARRSSQRRRLPTRWHQGFYSTLKRNDDQGSCCNLMDCCPTQSRMVGDHYEVKVDGE